MNWIIFVLCFFTSVFFVLWGVASVGIKTVESIALAVVYFGVATVALSFGVMALM